MVSFEEARQIVINHSIKLASETIQIHQAVNRILAEDVVSDMNFPPFDKAAMDGFAIRESEIDQELKIIETIAAGQIPSKTVNTGEASRIMTGAPVPKGADFVIQVELSKIKDDDFVKFSSKPKNNIIPKAEQVIKGETVLIKGEKIDARHIAVLASVGYHEVKVAKQPKVGIISTGDEIVEPNEIPNQGQIRNSNGHQLVAQVHSCNARPIYYGVIKDSYEDTYSAIEKGLTECDILILTGGVSMGDFDFVPKIMTDLGLNIHFDRVAVKPGKPTTFATKDKNIVFGLPGNPVSSYIQFELLTKPMIYKSMGHIYEPNISRLQLAEPYFRKKNDRLAHVPIQIKNNKIYFSNYKGSSHIHALTNSHGLIEIKQGDNEIKEGDFVDVRLFQ